MMVTPLLSEDLNLTGVEEFDSSEKLNRKTKLGNLWKGAEYSKKV